LFFCCRLPWRNWRSVSGADPLIAMLLLSGGYIQLYHELKAGIEYDYVIRNDEIDRAAIKLVAIITAERCRVRRSEYFQLLKDIVGEQGVMRQDDEPTAH
jgi:hypothetical protein